MSGPLKIDDTMGAAFIGVVVAASLWGVSCVQVWYYYTMYPKDAWYLKLLVAAVLIFDTIHQMLITHTLYTYLVSNFDNPLELGNLVWSLLVEVLFNGCTALLVQCFLTFRVWKLSNKSYILTGAVFLLVLAEFVSVVVYVIKSLKMTTFAELTKLKDLSMAVNALAAAGDVLIAVVLCYMLQKSRTSFKRSDTMISKLIIFTINTGLMTSICAVASLISIIAAPTTFIYITFYFTLGRFYSNSLMATLNARKAIRNAGEDESMSVSLRGIQRTGLSTANFKAPTNNIAIKVESTREFLRDRHDLYPGLPPTDEKIDMEQMDATVSRSDL
ncbi:hypothetical protein PILCRDRAFT_818965 [Piloderma croceum F 1598]|uniref:DUF6534 domain-containing protein n=1 Tax=Piloderma croceum (strain F 1598) TaxID=765440 RepID=A0A0C3C2Y0_PILCF|nr:hypothetical protein PILCRDRAFT_818965 [Piloderma croceum F 1598]